MAHPKVDLEAMWPDPKEARRKLQRDLPRFMECPGGHGLPYRKRWGRCTPLECCDRGVFGTTPHDTRQESKDPATPYKRRMDMLPVGFEPMAVQEKPESLAEDQKAEGQYTEASIIAQQYGGRLAREAFWPFPAVPKPREIVDGEDPLNYVKQRLEAITPRMIEEEVFEALHGTSEQRSRARRSLLNRAGVGEKPEEKNTSQGPVVIVNMAADMSPYRAAVKTVPGKHVITRGQDSGQESQPYHQIEAGEEPDE